MTKNIKENPLSSEKNHYLKHSSKEENAENGLIHKRKIKRKNSGGIILLIILLLGIVWYCWSNYTPVTYLQVEEFLSIPNEGISIEIELSTDAISSSISSSSSEDWIDCRVSGKTLYIFANTNSQKERSATITISAHSSFFGSELSDRKQATITVSQETGYASYLSVSNNDIYLPAKGGKSSVSINTDGIFVVSTAPAPWITTSVNGKTLNLECGENMRFARSSYLILKSGTKTLRLDITQSGKYATRLDVSSNNVAFSAEGGNRNIKIYTDGECSISTLPESWAHVTINGDSVSVQVDENPETKRIGYLVLKSGKYTERIKISQEGMSATCLSVSNENVSFSYSGGSRAITVSTDGTWHISTETAGWGHTSISGNTITLRIDENPSSSPRNSFFIIKSGSLEKRINISQDGKPATCLSVSNENVSFSYSGGSRAITVSTDGTWHISTETAGWGHTSISGNTITLRIDENLSSSPRNSFFVIKSGSLEKRINISQYGKPAIKLSVSTENVFFGKNGGSHTITVSTNGEWEIGVGTESWAHTSISGNIISLRVDKNNSGDDRTDYFTIVAGEKTVQINIYQDGGPSAEVKSIWVEHNVPRTGYNNVFDPYFGWQTVPYTYYVMGIHVDFDVYHMKGETIKVCAYFYDDDGDRMTTSNNRYRTTDGQVTVQESSTATYENTSWSNFILEIPYSVMQKGGNKFIIQIHDSRGKALGTSEYEYFTVK